MFVTRGGHKGEHDNAPLIPRLPYDPVRDFAPVTQLTSGPAIVVVHPSLPARSVKELIQLAKDIRAALAQVEGRQS